MSSGSASRPRGASSSMKWYFVPDLLAARIIGAQSISPSPSGTFESSGAWPVGSPTAVPFLMSLRCVSGNRSGYFANRSSGLAPPRTAQNTSISKATSAGSVRAAMLSNKVPSARGLKFVSVDVIEEAQPCGLGLLAGGVEHRHRLVRVGGRESIAMRDPRTPEVLDAERARVGDHARRCRRQACRSPRAC